MKPTNEVLEILNDLIQKALYNFDAETYRELVSYHNQLVSTYWRNEHV